jgi:type I restriction enzyme S subunit
MMNILSSKAATNQIYINLRDSNAPAMLEAKELFLTMWKKYSKYADKHFHKEIRRDFNARFWEMDLTCTLLEKKFEIYCPKPGPDIKIQNNIWVEAVCPTPGSFSNSNRVPEIQYGIAQEVESDLIKSRFISSIKSKHDAYLKYITNRTINLNDPYIIAVNGCQIPGSNAEFNIPIIARAVLSIGSDYVTFDRLTGNIIDRGLKHQDSIKKNNGALISQDTFLNPDYSGISAILYSNVSLCNRTSKLGQDYLLIHNPIAKNPLPESFLGF